MGQQEKQDKNGGKFCAYDFVTDLIEKGHQIPCDETNDGFKNKRILPTYYDPEKFKRGQQLFHKHIYAMLFSKMMGLVTLLSVPDLASILKFTHMSSDPKTAYKRYLGTVFHMYIWYNNDFSPESKLWTSIEKVKFKHNFASRRSYNGTKTFISQKNMALTQFGFMGFAVCNTKLVGLHDVNNEDLEAFTHIWRVIGYLLGIEDRFNICRESIEETREICVELADRVFKPEIQKKHEDFLNLSYALLKGMWCMMPLLQYKAFIHLVAKLVTKASRSNNNDNKIDHVDFQLNLYQKIYAQAVLIVLFMLRFSFIRIFQQYVMYISFWLMEHFPFLAYYSFGKANSYVNIFS